VVCSLVGNGLKQIRVKTLLSGACLTRASSGRVRQILFKNESCGLISDMRFSVERRRWDAHFDCRYFDHEELEPLMRGDPGIDIGTNLVQSAGVVVWSLSQTRLHQLSLRLPFLTHFLDYSLFVFERLFTVAST
jgi:hypothetical protein